MNTNDEPTWKRVDIVAGIVAILAVAVVTYERIPVEAAESAKVMIASGIGARTERFSHVVIRIPVGTTVSVRRTSPVSLQGAKPGDAVTAVTTEEIRYKGELVIPIGTALVGRVTAARPVLRVAFHRIGSYKANLVLASALLNESVVLRFTDELIVR